ncbi:hypothetical protein WS68_00770 [Burkholderia sp. TSV86]|nr:hypothetical protein WS68_00770 [Burkholderia sp. TSV86]
MFFILCIGGILILSQIGYGRGLVDIFNFFKSRIFGALIYLRQFLAIAEIVAIYIGLSCCHGGAQ